MDVFQDKTALVTGGASGIGLAVSRALAARGALVTVADIDGAAAAAAAPGMPGGRARAVTLDVRDAGAVEQAVNDVVSAHGRLDYLFNNAGIFICGDARHMTVADWQRITDVNVRGVLNGIAAAYPLMVRQGFGHIVNTASVAGLIPVPGATAYAMTKHAVVGVSTSLRGEAAGLGVKVSAVCPGFVDTPIKEHATYLNLNREAVLRGTQRIFYPVERCADAIVRGVARNRPIILVTPMAPVAWSLYRLAPRLMVRLARTFAERSPLLKR